MECDRFNSVALSLRMLFLFYDSDLPDSIHHARTKVIMMMRVMWSLTTTATKTDTDTGGAPMNLGHARSGLQFSEPLLSERSVPGRRGDSLPHTGVTSYTAESTIPANLIRTEGAPLPELSEPDVVRHFTRLSQWNFSIDSGFYPLGSCTMKYNPRINEKTARIPGFTNIHPYQPVDTVQGALELIYNLEKILAEVSGFARITLQPAAGAHGELTGMMMVRAHHRKLGANRRRVLIPDSAHGTNPASSALNGYDVETIRSSAEGILDPGTLEAAMGDDVAAVMLTNPNTLGLFESHIRQIIQITHAKGALLYCDGANMNAILGKTRPGDWGVDVMQFNLHKTFSTPHGGGGPGSGPVGISALLEPYLPTPVVVQDSATDKFNFDYNRPDSIGRVKSFYGNFSVMVRAYTYLRELGAQGLKDTAEMAVLAARYLRERLRAYYHLPYERDSLHEFVLSDKDQKETGVKTLDIAKRLLDYGYHPPTVYFPLIVHGALMIEPTESESKDTLDDFADAMIAIANEAKQDPAVITSAPSTPLCGRLDEATAARRPVLTWNHR